MAAFLSGAECGPGNALKGVNNRLDVDRSLQRDRLVSTPNTAGPSSHFRPSSSPASRPQNTFDLNALRQHLSPSPLSQDRQNQHVPSFRPSPAFAGQAGSSDWAQTFVSQPTQHVASPAQRGGLQNGWEREFAAGDHMTRTMSPPGMAQGQAPWQRGAVQHYPQQQYQPAQPFYQPAQAHSLNYPSMASEPMYHGGPHPDVGSTRQNQQQPIHQQAPAQPLTESQEVLADTAKSFVDDLQADQGILEDNPKLAKSQFMSLIKGLGDRKVVTEEGKAGAGEEVGEGARFVNRTEVNAGWANDFASTSGPQTAQASAGPGTQEPHQLGETAARMYAETGGPIHRSFGHYTSLQRAPLAPQLPLTATNQVSQSEWDRQFMDQEAILQSHQTRLAESTRRKSVHFDEGSQEEAMRPMGNGVPSSLEEALAFSATSIPGMSSSWQEEGLDDSLDFDEETFYDFNGPMRVARGSDTRNMPLMEGWNEMGKEWEAYERQNGLAKGNGQGHYLFQRKNPYTPDVRDMADPSPTSPTFKGVLELEAEVHNDPTSYEAWYALGLKQQENEREDQAILALSKVIQLQPDYREAYLALAVSYTNEGEKEAANTMLERWIDLSPFSSSMEMDMGSDVDSGREALGYVARRGRVVERLIDLANLNPEEVDPEVQIALGVLFNASEEFDKAEDCFSAALEVRPYDWLLHNRIGATLANSGRSNEAITHYERALSLHPNFVRALFNLGISYINLAQYNRAAQNLVDALRLQHADATEGYGSAQLGDVSAKGIGSGVLWTTLRNACLHMGRQDLVAAAARKDLAAFPMDLMVEGWEDRQY